MLGRILGNGGLKRLASFVSPAFFDVMPAKALWTKGKALIGASRSGEAFRHAVTARQMELSRSELRVSLALPGLPNGPVAAAERMDEAARAAQVVELYFYQLFQGGPTLLDLRASAFSVLPTGLLWRPAPWIADWSDDFIEPLRAMYRGFYTGDDGMFRRGLASLKLEGSEDLFRDYFGHNQSTMRFRTQDFVGTFHHVFLRCRDRRVTLHPDFVWLGFYLAALYDHLEDLGVPVDVRAGFERATGSAVTTSRRGELQHA